MLDPDCITPEVAARFWTKVDRSGGPDACWPWTGGTVEGYGSVSIHNHQFGAHVVSFVMANGAIPDGLCVLHECDNRPCVNPAHLFSGTKGDNIRDCLAKGRIARGTTHGMAKLTEADVREIRRRHEVDRASKKSLGRQFNVSDQSILNIIRRRTWRHVE